MVLAYVLWGIALLATMALSVLSVGGTSYRVSSNLTLAAQAEASADWAVHRAILGLLDRRADRRWRVDGTVREITAGAFIARVAIQDEFGRIDLNHADAPLVKRLFTSVGVSEDAASSLTDKIQDWREPGALRRLNGAKVADYAAAAISYRPRGAPFQSVDELQLVMGMTPALFQRVAPALTVHSGRPALDPQFAPREALLALPGMSREAVANVIAARSRAATLGAGNQGVIDPSLQLAGRAFSIRAVIVTPTSSFAREVVVRLTDDPAQMHWVLSWRSLSAASVSGGDP